MASKTNIHYRDWSLLFFNLSFIMMWTHLAKEMFIPPEIINTYYLKYAFLLALIILLAAGRLINQKATRPRFGITTFIDYSVSTVCLLSGFIVIFASGWISDHEYKNEFIIGSYVFMVLNVITSMIVDYVRKRS